MTAASKEFNGSNVAFLLIVTSIVGGCMWVFRWPSGNRSTDKIAPPHRVPKTPGTLPDCGLQARHTNDLGPAKRCNDNFALQKS